MPGSQAAPGEAAEAGHLAEAGHIAAALEAVRASAAARARYSLSTARRTKAVVEERSARRVARRRLWKSAQHGASHGCGRATARRRHRSQSGVARVVVGTADSDGRYTREVTRLACMQAEAATGACTGAPASHVALSRYGAQHGAPCRHLEVRRSARRAWIPWWRRRGKRPRRAGDWTCHCPLHVAFSRPLLSLSPDEGEH